MAESWYLARQGEPRAGDLFIADTFNNAIREVTPAGIISTVVNSSAQPGGESSGASPAASHLSTPYDAYAVAEVLTDALAKAGSTTPGKLNTAISHTDAQTTAGPVKFSQSTHTAIIPCYITQWQNGKLVQVQPLAPGLTFDVPTAGLG